MITFVTSWPESILIGVLGFVVGHRAMKEAMAGAKLTGIGAVTIRNTNHFGARSACSLLAVKENMIGFACTTSGRMAAAPEQRGL